MQVFGLFLVLMISLDFSHLLIGDFCQDTRLESNLSLFFKPSDMLWLMQDRSWKRLDLVFESRSFRLLYVCFVDWTVGRTISLRFFIKFSIKYSAWKFLLVGERDLVCD